MRSTGKVLLFVLCIVMLAAGPTSAGDDQGFFLIITDIHFDPFADPSIVTRLEAAPLDQWRAIFESSHRKAFAKYGSDANYPLMTSAIEAARLDGIKYDFILYPGDYLSHDFTSDYRRYVGGEEGLAWFVERTMGFVANQLHEAFPDTPIIGALGNNDSLCGDYMIAPESPLLAALAPEWAELADAPLSFGDFPVGGFYAMAHPTVPDHEFIVLNDIFWSIKYTDACNPDGGDPGAAQLAWLQWTLYRIQQQGHTASLMLHVPPGINAYSSSKGDGECASRVTRFWTKEYSDAFLKLVREYSAILENSYTGHTHMDDFRVISDDAGVPFLPTLITPAVSPIFGNNPAFSIVTYDRSSGELLDYTVYHLTNLEKAGSGEKPVWQVEYGFSKAYGFKSISPETLAELSGMIQTDANVRKLFMDYYAAETSAQSPITDDNWTAYQCAQTNITVENFIHCHCGMQ